MPHLLSARDLDRAAIDAFVLAAMAFDAGERAVRLDGRVVALAFFEPSLRTAVGFEVAALRLGAGAVAVGGARHAASMSKPESLADTLRVLGAYCDVICIRHPDVQSPRIVAGVAGVPVVNCGNGVDEHPTQALVDVFAMHRLRGGVDGARVAIVGDLRHMRSAHSLLLMLARHRDVVVRCIAPPELRMPPPLVADFRANATGRSGIEQVDTLALDDVDIVYVAGFPPGAGATPVPAAVRARFALSVDRLADLSPHAHVLSPLPRVDEIDPAVDELPCAAYFEQSALGLAMRMAVLEHALSEAGVSDRPGARRS